MALIILIVYRWNTQTATELNFVSIYLLLENQSPISNRCNFVIIFIRVIRESLHVLCEFLAQNSQWEKENDVSRYARLGKMFDRGKNKTNFHLYLVKNLVMFK